MEIRVFENGIRFVSRNMSHPLAIRPPSLQNSTRGAINGFSRMSRLRLRDFLLSRSVPSYARFGVTLTIPRSTDISLALVNFREAVHRLRVYFLRRWPSSGFVWRVELQRNRMPHLHLVAFVPSTFYSDGSFDSGHFLSLWYKSVRGLFPLPSLSDFLRFSTRCARLDDSISALRYLCDHTGKRKQHQLGFKGRQWGVVGRDNFVFDDYISYSLPPCLHYRLRRFIRRLTSFSVSVPCVFGNKHIRRKSNVAVNFIKIETVRKWLVGSVGNLSLCSPLSFLYSDEMPF